MSNQNPNPSFDTSNSKKRKRLSVKELCYIGIFTTVIAICAQILVPLPGGVPFTLQVTAISLAGLIIGPKNGTIAVIIYIILGAVGAPVFHGFSGGLGVFMRPTGGFILSFPLVSLLAGLGEKRGIIQTYIGLIIGTALNLVCGMLYFAMITGVSISAAFATSVAPFLLSSTIVIIVLPIISKSIKSGLKKARLLTS